jgi:hypothetical protein
MKNKYPVLPSLDPKTKVHSIQQSEYAVAVEIYNKEKFW